MKGNAPSRLRAFLVSGLYLSFFVLFLLYPDGYRSIELRLEVNAPESPEYFEVFWAKGHAYRQENSARLYYDPTSPYERFASFTLAPAQRTLRVDPGSSGGIIAIVALRISVDERTHVLDAHELKRRIELINDIDAVELRGDRLLLRSIGADPHFALDLVEIIPAQSLSRRAASALFLFLATASYFAVEVLVRRRAAWALERRINRWGFALFLVPVGFPLLLSGLGYGCPDKTCHADAFLGAAKLVPALAVFWIFGYAAGRKLLRINMEEQVYLPMVLGQTILVLYAYLRSLTPVPLSQYEILVMAALLLIWLLATQAKRTQAQIHGLVIPIAKVTFLLTVLAIISSRELPRELMLSTDPDVHLAFIRQFLHQGGIPWNAGEWGPASLGYPMAIAALGGLWSWLTFFDPGDTVAHLPMVLSVLGSLSIIEFWRFRNRPSLLLLTVSFVLLLTFAGLLIPLLTFFAHQEGTARQISLPFMVLFIYAAHLLARAGTLASPDVQLRLASLLLGTLLVLAFLNPVNLVAPAIGLTALSVYWLVAGRRLGLWMTVAPALLIALPLDPYYYGLAFGPAVEPKLELQGARELAFDEIFASFALHVLSGHVSTAHLSLFVGGRPTEFPDFLLFSSIFSALILARFIPLDRKAITKTWSKSLSVLLALIAALFAFFLTDSFFAALSQDARFYLLAPYFAFSISQYQILFLLMLGVAALLGCFRMTSKLSASAIFVVTTSILAFVLLRGNYPYTSLVRSHYCGAPGCVTQAERQLVDIVTGYLSTLEHPPAEPKILVPNGVHIMGVERWLFPVNVARLLARNSDWPLSFYYYIGSHEYTTVNYVRYLCHGANREWLHSLRVGYVILPEKPDGYCLNSELLVDSEVVFAYPNGRPGFLRLPGASEAWSTTTE